MRKFCQFFTLLLVSPFVLLALGVCLAWDAAGEFLGWED